MLSKGSRILIAVAALSLGLIYVLPLWTIDLEAPQYPEGLGMLIQVNTVEGQKPNDLNNINNLNHYIGMKRIEPDAIPELRIMPWIVALLILGGLAAAVTGKRKVLYGWVGFFILVSVVGLVDFWMWEYDYGHNLDEENAIIKIPGMNYQPPLIGSKQLLNFTAHSWPGAGGWIAIASCLIGVGVAGREWKRARSQDGSGSSGPSLKPLKAVLLPTLAVGAMAGCGEPEPREVAVGVDQCAHCLMTVADPAFAAEAVTRTGRAYIYDSVECLAAAVEAELADEDLHSLWVTDFPTREELIPAGEAHYLVSESLNSPMGLGISAFGSAAERDAALETHGGEAMDWDAVRAHVQAEWGSEGGGGHGGHGSGMRPDTVGA